VYKHIQAIHTIHIRTDLYKHRNLYQYLFKLIYTSDKATRNKLSKHQQNRNCINRKQIQLASNQIKER